MTTVRADSSQESPGTTEKSPVRPRLKRLVVLTVCAGGAWAALQITLASPDGDPAGGGSTTSSVGSGVTEFTRADRGEPITLGGRTLAGDEVRLEQLRGSAVVLNVWGSWCAPCREEAPVLADADRTYPESDVRFLGINVRDNESSAVAFERRYGVRYPSIADFDGQALLAVNDYIPVNAVPVSLVLDRQGRVAARILGPVRAATLTALLETVLAESRTPTRRADEQSSEAAVAP